MPSWVSGLVDFTSVGLPGRTLSLYPVTSDALGKGGSPGVVLTTSDICLSEKYTSHLPEIWISGVINMLFQHLIQGSKFEQEGVS